MNCFVAQKKESREAGMDFEFAKSIVPGFSSCDMAPLGNILLFSLVSLSEIVFV